jgi:hypothetical protein
METLQTMWRLGPGRSAWCGALAQLEEGSLGEDLVLALGVRESRDPLELRVEGDWAVGKESPKGRGGTALIDLSSVLTAPVRVAVDVKDKSRTTEPKTRVLGCDEVAQEVKASVPVRATGGVGETTHLRDALADIRASDACIQ